MTDKEDASEFIIVDDDESKRREEDPTQENIQLSLTPQNASDHTVSPTNSHESVLALKRGDIVDGAARTGVSITTNLVFSATVANPIAAAAVAAYESFRAVSDYRRGALNVLGLPMDRTDLALRIGKEVGTAATGLAIGYAIGSLIGLGSIPVVGQVIATTVLSVALNFCVVTLLTRHVDRLILKIKLRRQYGYPRNEQGARRRFEELLEPQHCLLSFETCRIVQHYRDYRVACGWEGLTDISEYRASANIALMPISFQHFAIVQLQRKWGFVNERNECRKVYRALLLVHHPDRGGSGELTGVLNHDFEVYAFCQGWHEDCRRLCQENEEAIHTDGARRPRKRKKNAVVSFLQSLFRTGKNSSQEAQELCDSGLLALEAGTPLELSELEELSVDEPDESIADEEYAVSETKASTTQHSICVVLAAIQRCYQLTTEAVPFSWLKQLHRDYEGWSRLKVNVHMFIRMHVFVHIADEVAARDTATTVLPVERSCYDFRWCTKCEAVAKREDLRRTIVATCFPKHVTGKLIEAFELWKTAQSLAHSFFKQHTGATADVTVVAGTGQTLSTLFDIQTAIQALCTGDSDSLEESDETEDERTVEFADEVKIIGLIAGFALSGAHAVDTHQRLRETCKEYYRARDSKMKSVASLRHATHEVEGRTSKSTTKKEKLKSSEQREGDTKESLLFHQVFTEVDAATCELYNIYSVHLPENIGFFKLLPSSCARCAHQKCEIRRYVKYERERTLVSYKHVVVEPRNVLEPHKPATYQGMVLKDGKEISEIEFALLCAEYVDPISGTVTPCWLKRYTFPKYENESSVQTTKVFKTLMERELRLQETCASCRVTSAIEVFGDEHTNQIYFHLPRGGTQVRFSSPQDILKRIKQHGVRWLHGALQAIIDIHSCQVTHGDICMSNFTHDDFGNTTLGFFSNSLKVHKYGTKTAQDDAADFGVTLHAEVLPYLRGTLPQTKSSPHRNASDDRASSGVVTGCGQAEQQIREMFNVFLEVADRLTGKLEPRWSLLDARGFVRRLIKVNYDCDERQYLFTKEVSYPPYWTAQKNMGPVSLFPDNRVLMHRSPQGTAVFLNRNIYLWETYWKYRQQLVLARGCSSFSVPVALREQPHFLPCSDDCEVNERFLWYNCKDEEEAWQICLEGTKEEKCRFAFVPPWMEAKKQTRNDDNPWATWAIAFRVALGAVVSDEDEMETCCVPSAGPDTDLFVVQRCAMVRGSGPAAGQWELSVPSPGTRSYPEYLVRWFHS